MTRSFLSGLTPRQAAAFERPCLEAHHTQDERFRSRRRYLNRVWSVILTANIGLE